MSGVLGLAIRIYSKNWRPHLSCLKKGLTSADLWFLGWGNGGERVCRGKGEERRVLQGAASGLLPKIKPFFKSWRGAAGEGRRWERREGTKQPLYTKIPAGKVSNTRLVQRE